jgi:hypothetical protein
MDQVNQMNKLSTVSKIVIAVSIVIIIAFIILNILNLLSFNGVKSQINELNSKIGEDRIKSIIDKYRNNENIVAKNLNVSESINSRNIKTNDLEVSDNISANTMSTSGKFIANEIESLNNMKSTNLDVSETLNVKNLNVTGNLSTDQILSKIQGSDILSNITGSVGSSLRYMEIDLSDQSLFKEDRFYPVVFGLNDSGQLKLLEFTIASFSGLLQLSNPSIAYKTVNQNLLKFTGQGRGWNAQRSNAEILYTYHSDVIPTGSTSSFIGKTFGPIVSSMQLMGSLKNISTNETVDYNVCLYVRGLNKYFIRTNASSVNILNKGGKIDGANGSLLNILKLKSATELVDDTILQAPIYNTITVLENQNLNPGLELFWNGLVSPRGKFFYSETDDFQIGIDGNMSVSGNISNYQWINLNFSVFNKTTNTNNFQVKYDSNYNILDTVQLYKCNSSTDCDLSLFSKPFPTIFKPVIFETFTKPNYSKLSYKMAENGAFSVGTSGYYEIDIYFLLFVILNGVGTGSLTRLDRLLLPPSITIKLADTTGFKTSTAITDVSKPSVIDEFICPVNNIFSNGETGEGTVNGPKINKNNRISSGILREKKLVNLIAGRNYSFIIIDPISDIYKIRYGTNPLDSDRGIFLHKSSNVNIKFLN